MLKVWGRRNSSNVQKVMWLIGELGLDHEHIPAGGSFGLTETPEFRAMNPHGRVPVIDDNGTVVWESQAILRYLATLSASPPLWPETPGERAQQDQWMDWSVQTLQRDFLIGVFWGFYRTPEAKRDQHAIEAAVATCTRHFQLLDTVLADRPFMSGSAFGLADIVVGSNLYRYYTLDIDRPAVPNVEAWRDRIESRPAYRDHVMVDYSELFGRLSF
ncbi:MAG: glutathione S-transferase family protein [Pseudomonadota bacterium]